MIDANFREIESKARAEASRDGRNLRHDVIISSFVTPTVIGIWVGIMNFVWRPLPLLWVIVLALLIAAGIYYSVRTYSAMQSVQDLYFRAEQIERSRSESLKIIDNLERQIEYLSISSRYSLAFLAM
jgi:hypothetical protein